MTPATQTIPFYRGQTAPLSFVLNDMNGDPLDLSLFGAFTYHVFRAGQEASELFEVALSVSANVLSGEVTDTQTKQLRPIVVYGELRTSIGGNKVIALALKHPTLDATSGSGVNEPVVTLQYDPDGDTFVVNLDSSPALAFRALSALQPPANTLVVDLAYTDSGASWQYATVEGAIAFARSQGGVWRIVVGLGYVLPTDENLYELRAEGIDVQFTVDPWKDYILTGGDIAEGEMKYVVDESKLNINIRG